MFGCYSRDFVVLAISVNFGWCLGSRFAFGGSNLKVTNLLVVFVVWYTFDLLRNLVSWVFILDDLSLYLTVCCTLGFVGFAVGVGFLFGYFRICWLDFVFCVMWLCL